MTEEPIRVYTIPLFPLTVKTSDKNRKTGKPTYAYVGFNSYKIVHYTTQSKIMLAIKIHYKSIIDDFRAIPQDSYPIKIHIEMHKAYARATWDLDNLMVLYRKAFWDTLKDLGIIIEDKITCATGNSDLFYPVDDDKDRKLVFKLYKDDRVGLRKSN